MMAPKKVHFFLCRFASGGAVAERIAASTSGTWEELPGWPLLALAPCCGSEPCASDVAASSPNKPTKGHEPKSAKSEMLAPKELGDLQQRPTRTTVHVVQGADPRERRPVAAPTTTNIISPYRCTWRHESFDRRLWDLSGRQLNPASAARAPRVCATSPLHLQAEIVDELVCDGGGVLGLLLCALDLVLLLAGAKGNAPVDRKKNSAALHLCLACETAMRLPTITTASFLGSFKMPPTSAMSTSKHLLLPAMSKPRRKPNFLSKGTLTLKNASWATASNKGSWKSVMGNATTRLKLQDSSRERSKRFQTDAGDFHSKRQASH